MTPIANIKGLSSPRSDIIKMIDETTSTHTDETSVTVAMSLSTNDEEYCPNTSLTISSSRSSSFDECKQQDDVSLIRLAIPISCTLSKCDTIYEDDIDECRVPTPTICNVSSDRIISYDFAGNTNMQANKSNNIFQSGKGGFKWESKVWTNFLERAMKMNTLNAHRNNTTTPLHEAISMKAPPYIISRLIKVHPQAVRIQNGAGFTPLHCAIERYDTSEEVLTMLLNADPSTARLKCRTTNNKAAHGHHHNHNHENGYTPVDLMWKRYIAPEPYRSDQIKAKAAIRRRAMEYLVMNKGWSSLMLDDILSSNDNNSSESCPLLREFWVIFSKFLRAFYGLGLPIHAVLAMDAPDPLLVRLVTALYPSHLQVAEPKSGFLPLHMVVHKNANNDRILETTRSLFIILDADRSACAVTDNQGRLPFHLALLTGKPWMFLKLLVAAYPRVLQVTCTCSTGGLNAFQFASSIVASNEEDGDIVSCVDMSTVFLLLRADPSVLQKHCR